MGGHRLLADGRDRVGHRQGAPRPGRRRRDRRRRRTYRACGTTHRRRAPEDAPRRTDASTPTGCPAELEGALQQPLPHLREGVRALGEEPTRSKAATPPRSSSSSAPTPSSPSSSTTGSPAGRSRSPTTQVVAPSPASSPLFSQRRRRQAARPAAHDPHRLRAARVRRGDEGRLQEGRRRARSRSSRRSTARRNPGPDVEKIDRRGPAARGDEHRRQARQARRAGPLRRQRLDAHRGLGRQHGHAHPRRPRVRQPAPLRAGRRPRPAPPLATPSNDEGHVRARVRERLRHPVPVHPRPTSRSRTRLPPKPVDRGLCRRGPRRAADQSSPGSTATASSSPTTRSGSTSTTLPSSRSVRTTCRAGSRWAASSASASVEDDDPTQYRPQEVAFALAKRDPRRQLQHRRRQAALALPASWSRCAASGSTRRCVDHRRLQPRLPDDDHRGADECSPPRRCGTRSSGRTATAASGCAR